jgi:hypothetical protein
MDRIFLNHALREMEQLDDFGQKVTFSIEWQEYSKSRGKAGNWRKEDKATRHGLACNMKDNKMIGIKPYGFGNHITAVHIHSIKYFNGKEVFI